MTVSAVRPWRSALQRDARFAASVFGPVLLSALRRLASIWRYEVIGCYFRNWVRFAVLIRPDGLCVAADAFLAKRHGPRRQHRYRSCPTKWLRHHCGALRDGDPGKGHS